MRTPSAPDPNDQRCRVDRLRRVFDVLAAGAALTLLAPVEAAVAVAVAHEFGRPVLFRQNRAGQHGVEFELLKFRTMLTPEQAGGTHDDAARLTPLGAWLRSTSLDELPSLWNILRGDMSLVGPRPLLPHYVPHYSPRQARRHQVRPGLTGLAQVSGRNSLSWEERLDLDVDYVERRSLRLDAAIIARTILVVLRRTGISAPGNATMPAFVALPPHEVAS